MILTLNGKPGSGKSSVAKLLSERLHLTYVDIGELRRRAAAEKGMTLEEYNAWGETTDETDRHVDEYQKKLGKREDNLIVSGRTSFHFIPHSVKIFLDVDMDEAARRVFSDERLNERNESNHIGTQEQVRGQLEKRMQSDTSRYKKYYNLDVYDTSLYDLVLDTTHISIEETYEKILEYLKSQELLTAD